MRLGHGVEATVKVGRISLDEARPAPGVSLVILVDAARGEDGAMDAVEVAAVGEVQGTNDIGPHRGLLVVFAPVHVGAAGTSGGVDDMGWADSGQLGQHSLAVLHTDGRRVDLLALVLEQLLEMSGDPAIASPDQEPVGSLSVACCHGRILASFKCGEECLFAGGHCHLGVWLGRISNCVENEEMGQRERLSSNTTTDDEIWLWFGHDGRHGHFCLWLACLSTNSVQYL